MASNTKHAFNSIFGCVFPNSRQETLFLRVLPILQQKTRQILTLQQNSICFKGLQIFVFLQTFWQTPFTRSDNFCYLVQCTMVPLSTKSCFKSRKLRPILNGQFCHAISKDICLNVPGSKATMRNIVFFVIFKL